MARPPKKMPSRRNAWQGWKHPRVRGETQGLDAAMQAVNAKKPASAGFAYIDCEHGENISSWNTFVNALLTAVKDLSFSVVGTRRGNLDHRARTHHKGSTRHAVEISHLVGNQAMLGEVRLKAINGLVLKDS